MQIQSDIKERKYDLVCSYISGYELSKNPFPDRKATIEPWRSIASEHIDTETDEIIETAEKIAESGIKTFDALHISCAKNARCDYFITTDKKLYKVELEGLSVSNPVEFIIDMEEQK